MMAILFSRTFFLFFIGLIIFSEKSYSVLDGPYCCCSYLFAGCKDGDKQHCCSGPYMKGTIRYNAPSSGLACRNVKMSGDIQKDPNKCGNS